MHLPAVTKYVVETLMHASDRMRCAPLLTLTRTQTLTRTLARLALTLTLSLALTLTLTLSLSPVPCSALLADRLIVLCIY